MKLQDLNLRVGDVVAITLSSEEVVQHTIARITDDGVHYSKETGGDLGNAFPWRIIRRASTPAHIITHEGREYDLTKLETPFGLLPEPVRDALQAWPHGAESFQGTWMVVSPMWSPGNTYRAKPAPVEVRVTCTQAIAEHGSVFATFKLGTCIKRADGTIDWNTWEPEQ